MQIVKRFVGVGDGIAFIEKLLSRIGTKIILLINITLRSTVFRSKEKADINYRGKVNKSKVILIQPA